ncbi:ribonuclease P protein component [Halochromatium glycolicum]|uniref:ribonuclease P protein component n=1 Tax=Halochromatium glycolicum TaxID=85075 RepID=UPI001F5B636D|nr:ribonuclease P protein component [Halochromatium glycolicum]
MPNHSRQRPDRHDDHALGSPSASRFALPRSARLLHSSEFNRVFESPTRSADRYFTVLARPQAPSNRDRNRIGSTRRPRLGLAISKRCAARSVARNRIKRVIRESFRHVRDRLPGVDVVVLCRRAATSADNPSLRASLDAHWKRICR